MDIRQPWRNVREPSLFVSNVQFLARPTTGFLTRQIKKGFLEGLLDFSKDPRGGHKLEQFHRKADSSRISTGTSRKGFLEGLLDFSKDPRGGHK